MVMKFVPAPALLVFVFAALSGCRSPYYADRGALLGGLSGAGIGAAIGDASGNAGPGAVLGTAIGTMAGAAIGDSIDADLARSRAEIEARMGRQMQGAAKIEDVVAMTQAGLSEDVIATHIRASGVAQPLQVGDLIYLRNQGVSDFVIQTMQQTPQPQVAQAAYVAVAPPPPPRAVIVEHHYSPWDCGPAYCYPRHRHRHGHGVSWGFSFSK